MAINIRELSSTISQNEVIENISSIYEITSIQKVDQTKDYILKSQRFFIDIRALYSRLANALGHSEVLHRNYELDKTICVVMTSSGSFSGAADDEIIRLINEDSDLKDSEIVIVGRRGVAKLSALGRKYILSFDSPDITKPIDVSPLVEIIRKYKRSFVVYQTYQNLITQDILKMDLDPASSVSKDKVAHIDLDSYILEPSYNEILAYIEASILSITITQVIFEARLSEYANRFITSQMINQNAITSLSSLRLKYNQAKRRIRDERLREQIFQGGLN